jgi:ABC-2 type transport system permease protein
MLLKHPAAIMQQIIFLAMALVFSRDYEDDYFGTLIKESKLSLYHIAKINPIFLNDTNHGPL